MVNGKWNVHQGIARRMRKEKSVKNVHWSGYAAVQMCIVCVHIRNVYVFVCVLLHLRHFQFYAENFVSELTI